MNHPARTARGVSLIEALVALAVMAFGLLGVVGMQATLRANSDVAKQRAEAVRIAQAAVEDWRAFQQLASAGTLTGFDGIDTVAGVTTIGTNASYTRSAVVDPPVLAADAPRLKTVTMRVEWQDRSGQTPSVTLVSSIAGIAPQLGGTLGVPGDRAATQRPGGRHSAIPRGAVDIPRTGTSSFAPPGTTGVTWIFNNVTGVIERIINGAESVVFDGRLLSGYIYFAIGDAPTPAEAEQPRDRWPFAPAFDLEVRVAAERLREPTAEVRCPTRLHSSGEYAEYFCAVPLEAGELKWSGPSLIVATGASAIVTGSEVDPTAFRVCRYTSAATGVVDNANHPYRYVNVVGALANQNFLMISAGGASRAFSCPEDGPDPLINSLTVAHVPPR